MQPLVPEKSVESHTPKVENASGFVPLSRVSTALNRKKNHEDGGGVAVASHQNVKVEAIDEDGVVRKIRVFCSCGEIIEIDCGYPD